MENGVNIDELRENLIKNNPVAREKDFKVVDYEDGVSLTRYKGKNETLIIPEKINGKQVIAIHSGFLRNKKIKNVILPNGIKCIDMHAFIFKRSLEYIHLPESVTTIGVRAFSDCRSLTSVNIPESVTTIGECAFWNCSSLTSVNIPESVTTIGERAFWNCSSLTSVNIPESVTTIGAAAFPCEINISKENKNYSFCDGFLVDKTNEILVEHYDDSAFEEGKINIPAGIKKIAKGAFSNCSITSVNIPENFTDIDNNIFTDCKLLNSINVSDENKNYKSIDGVLFDKNGETLIRYPYARKGPYIIPENVTTIAAGAFKNSIGLTSVKIPESVTIIGESAFSGCLYLNSINIPENVTTIENYTFHNCRRLTSIHIPKNISSIGESAFCRCTSLKNINIPENHTFIDSDAFSECYRLPKIFYKTIKRNFGEDRIDRQPFAPSFESIGIAVFGFIFFLGSAYFFYSYFTHDKKIDDIYGGCFFLMFFIISLIYNKIREYEYKYDPSCDWRNIFNR